MGYVQSAFPNQKRVKLKYSQVFQLDTTTGPAGVERKFRANSINDPDFSIGGHQPMGHDQWAAAYLHYRVAASTISAQIVGVHDGTVLDNAVAWVALGATTSANTVATTAIERGRAVWKVLSNSHDTSAKALINSYDAKSFFGGQQAGGDEQKAAMGSNPVEDVLFSVGVELMNGAAVSRTYDVLITIDYDVLLTEPVQLDQS